MKDNLIMETIKKFPLEDIEQFVENLLDKKPVQKDTPIGDFISKCNISLDTRGSDSVNYFVFMHTFLAYLCCGLIDRIKNPVPTFFVSGHRDITEEEFDAHYKVVIQILVYQSFFLVIVMDSNGVHQQRYCEIYVIPLFGSQIDFLVTWSLD